MREESLTLQYRKLQKHELQLLEHNASTVLDAPVKRLNEMIEDKTQMDLLQKISEAVEPTLLRYLKGYIPFKDRQDRKRRFYDGIGIDEDTELAAVSSTVIDHYVGGLIEKSGIFALFSGGIGAIGGLPVALIELQVLINKCFETLECVCEAYGFDSNDYFEKVYRIMIVLFVLIPDRENRKSVYMKMKLIENWMRQNDIALTDKSGYYPETEVVAFGTSHLSRAVVVNRVYQAVPIAGALFGASLNYDFVKRLGKQGQIFYKRRYLERKLELT